MHKLLKNYSVVIPCPVDWGHMDAFQHVNNIIFFRYFENVRVEYGMRIGITDELESRGIGPILGHIECKYIKPLFFPDTALTGVRVASVQGSDMLMEYKIVSENRNEVVATGTSIGVYYHYRELHRMDYPEALIARIEKLEGRPVARSHSV
jgi:acyl-CoA thioester hydrolase